MALDIHHLNALLDKLVVQATVLDCDLHAEREAIVTFFLRNFSKSQVADSA